MPNADPGDLGRTLARLRLARGFTQQQVAARIPTYYSDAGAYGRIERGERHPDRDAVVAILVRGLLILDTSEINRVLHVDQFEPVSAEDVERLGLTSPQQPPTPDPEPVRRFLERRAIGILVGSLASAGLIALLIPKGAPFALLTSCLYAALYVVSLYLESAFEPERFPMKGKAVLTFGFVAVSSMAALATDRLLVDSGNSLALLFSLLIFLVAGGVQFLIALPALSETSIVPATFQTRTAQSAHLKNTGYFLLVVVLFWLPPFHCVSTLSREIRGGHSDWVRKALELDLILGHGVFALSVRWLLGLLLATLLISLYMGHVLLDNLRLNARLNSYTLLFYLRAFLYFLLCLICIGWYAYSLNELF